MKLDVKCIVCNIQQAVKVAEFAGTDKLKTERIIRRVLEYLTDVDYNMSNPQVMKGTWDNIIEELGDENPYRQIKRYYNEELLKVYDELEKLVEKSPDSFKAALKVAIIGNLIDFGPSHKFDRDILQGMLQKLDEQSLVTDDSERLREKLSIAKTLLYIGDNCGEIVLDKVFIEQIGREFPGIEIYFAVRGEPVINDVTLEDAKMTGMDDVARIIENGDGCPGTILKNTSDEFKKIFEAADVIIAKGQGNYEGLSEIKREGLFLLFMAKCPVVAKCAGVNEMEILCMENV